MRSITEKFLLNRIFDSLSAIFTYSALSGIVWLCKLLHIDIIRRRESIEALLVIFEYSKNHYIIDIVISDCSDNEVVKEVLEKLSKLRKLFKGNILQVCSECNEVFDQVCEKFNIIDYFAHVLMYCSKENFRTEIQTEAPINVKFQRLTINNYNDVFQLLKNWDEFHVNIADKFLKYGQSYGLYYDNKLIAFISTYAVSSKFWYLGGLFVHPEFRGKKLGKYLMVNVLNEAFKYVDYVFLSVEINNITARCLYSKIGFRSSKIQHIFTIF